MSCWPLTTTCSSSTCSETPSRISGATATQTSQPERGGAGIASTTQRHRAAAPLRPCPAAVPTRNPCPLPLSARHQSDRGHQQPDQSHQADGLRLPRRRLLLPQDSGGLPRNRAMNLKKEPPIGRRRLFPNSATRNVAPPRSLDLFCLGRSGLRITCAAARRTCDPCADSSRRSTPAQLVPPAAPGSPWSARPEPL